MQGDAIKYARIEDIPAETPIPMTQIDATGGRYADFGERMYCSECGVASARLARVDLWAVRHQPRPEHRGAVNRYCIEHLPTREWVSGEDHPRGHVREVTCPDCFMVVVVGSTCDTTGRSHEER